MSTENGCGVVGKACGVVGKACCGGYLYENELKCGICFDYYLCSSMKEASFGHHFCNECWTGYIHTSINDGLGCLILKYRAYPPCRG